MKDLNVAIIGCGRIAGHHCRSIVQNKGIRLVSVCDLNSEKANAYAKEFQVPAYVNYHTMLTQHPEIDVVAIITPSGMHYEHAKEIITQYKKHLIVEKPTFLKISHLKEIYSLAAKNNLQVFPVFQNRYNKAVQRVRSAIQNELGAVQIFSVRVRWCRPQRYYDLSEWRGTFAMDGGALTNQGIHHVDLMRFLGGEVTEVTSTMRTFGASIEVEDTCIANLKFASGAVGTLEVTTAARPIDYEASISVVAANGLAQIGGIAVNELQVFSLKSEEQKLFSEDFSDCVYGNGHQMLYADIVQHFAGIVKYPVSYEDALGTLQLLHAFYVSAETNRKIRPAEGQESIQLGRPDEQLANLYRTHKDNQI